MDTMRRSSSTSFAGLLRLTLALCVGGFSQSALHAVTDIAACAAVDLIVYSGTPSGVMAAVAAGREGRNVVLIEPRTRIGGMISGGLTKTDIGSPSTIG